MFRLSVFLLNSMSKLIHNRCTCKLIIKTLRLHTCMQTNNCVFVLCFKPLFSVVQLWNYTKTIYSPQAQWILSNNPLDFTLGSRGIFSRWERQNWAAKPRRRVAKRREKIPLAPTDSNLTSMPTPVSFDWHPQSELILETQQAGFSHA